MKKTYILDTNIPLLDPECLEKFEDNNIVLATITIKEIDKMKKRVDEVGKNARVFTRMLDASINENNIFAGIPLNGGGRLFFSKSEKEYLEKVRESFADSDNDDYILAVALKLHDEYIHEKNKLEATIASAVQSDIKIDTGALERELENLQEVILVSRDTNLRLRAKYFGIPAETYLNEQVSTATDLYSGWRIVPVSDEILNTYFVQKGAENKEEFVFRPPNFDYESLGLYPFEYVVLVDQYWTNTKEEREALFKDVYNTPILKYDAKLKVLVNVQNYKSYLNKYDIMPKNIQQKMAFDLLFDDRIKQKSLVGLAGSGKTLLALLASIIMVNDLEHYNEIIITRPPINMEYDLGFLPGTEEEKMLPYLRGFKGNLEFITSRLYKNEEEKENYSLEYYKIKTESMGYMRGETTHKSIIIIDESQNSTYRAMKTALTRIGKDSVVILMGDISQIDHHLLDATNNGLSYAIELMKDERLSGHITLEKGERSGLSEKIAEKWDKHLLK